MTIKQNTRLFIGQWRTPLLFVGVYLLWKLVDIFFLKWSLIQPTWNVMVLALTHLYQLSIFCFLRLIGYQVQLVGHDTVMLSAKSGIRVMEHCLSIAPTFIFVVTVILMKSDSITGKFLFAIAGALAIYAINVTRLSVYAVMHSTLPKSVSAFFHNYGYVAITYGLILLLLKWWIDRNESTSYRITTTP